MIDRQTIDKILDATNIVDVVGEFVTLRKSGVNYKGLCPFHDDKTPSFMVSPTKQICKCFSCGEGGTAINFLMKHEQITYPEALRWLAKKYNIEIQEKELTEEEKREQSDRESMFIVNEWAMNYFKDVLNNDPDGVAIGRQYFRSRGIRDDIVEKFNLGFSLSKRDALDIAAKKAGYQEEFLIKTGLCIKGEKGVYDRYAGRVIFPWFNVSGKVVAFGGRLLDARTKGVQQKYVNSPDSEIYHKERELYGLYQGKKAIAKENCVYMVEGYTDVISMHQCGIENVVANSGTALSVHQIRMLHRFTPNIVLLYDGDEAGIHAAMRGTDMLLAEGMNIKVLLLPDGDDPDSFSRKHTAANFRKYIEEHQADFIQFKSDLLLKNVTDPIKRSEAINSIVKSVSVIPDQIVRATYLTDCAHRLAINENTLISTMNKMLRQERESQQKIAEREREREANTLNAGTPAATSVTSQPLSPASPMEQASKVETLLVRMVMRHGGDIIYKNVEMEDGSFTDLTVAQFIYYDLGADNLSFSVPIYNKVLEEAVQHSGDSAFNASDYFTRHPDIQVSNLASELVLDPVQLSKSLQPKEEQDSLRTMVEHLILDFRKDYVEYHLKDLQRQISLAASDPAKMMELLSEYKDMQELRNRMAKKLGRNIVV